MCNALAHLARQVNMISIYTGRGKKENAHAGLEAGELSRLVTAEHTSRIWWHVWKESPPFPLPFDNRYFDNGGKER